MTSQMWRRLAPAAILLLGLALFLLFGLERYFSFEMLSRHHATLAAWVAQNFALAIVLFVLAYALVVAFSLPIDGERDVPQDTVFQIQFSRDIDEATLRERVLIRYAGRPLPGDNALDAAKFTYDGGLRTLRVDPGDLLRLGRVVEVVLLPGIKDIDGMPLETRPGVRAGAAADVLRFQVVAPGGLAGGR